MRREIVIFFFLFFASFANGRDERVLDFDKRISIIADKIYRRDDKRIVTTGNVIVSRGPETLYFEVGFFDQKKNVIEAEGKVRLTTPELSMHGSKFIYNLKNRSLKVYDPQIFTSTYSLSGQFLERIAGDVIIVQYAEYSNCKDCPESWSVYGEKITVTPNQYVTIDHMVFRVKGTSIAYLPYFILPIKKNRTTGFLFPHFYRSSLTRGLSTKIPFYWVISPSQDMTITPSVFGRRGGGGDFEYRSVFGEDKWLRFKTISWMDNEDEYDWGRHLAQYEHHFRWGESGNHHLAISMGRDKGMISILDQETQDFYYGNELGMEGFLEWRHDRGQISLSSYLVDNLIVEDTKKFDFSTVQILPRITASVRPVYLLQESSSILRNAFVGGEVELTNFQQGNRKREPSPYFRDMVRSNTRPFLFLNWKGWGPVKIKTRLDGSHQLYQSFQSNLDEEGGEVFYKWGLYAETELSLKLGKKYGKAYLKDAPLSGSKEDLRFQNQKENDTLTTIGNIPSYGSFIKAKKNAMRKNGYFHEQQWKIIHHKNLKESYGGNLSFAQQFSSVGGIFDQYDIFRNSELEILEDRSLYRFSRKNVIELQWNNFVVKKSPTRLTDNFQGEESRLRDYFSYGEIFRFNVSQGLYLASEDLEGSLDTGGVLTRLAVDMGLNFNGVSVESRGIYLYNDRYIYDLDLGYHDGMNSYLLGFRYNSAVKTAISNNLKLGATLKPIPQVSLSGTYDLKLGDSKGYHQRVYDFIYTPDNRCWGFNLGFSDNSIDKQVRMSFRILWDKEWL